MNFDPLTGLMPSCYGTSDDLWNGELIEVCNELHAIFQSTGIVCMPASTTGAYGPAAALKALHKKLIELKVRV